MSTAIDLTTDAVQVTDGSTGAHITWLGGTVMYADSQDSAAWHQLYTSTMLEVRPPLVIYLKAKLAGGAQVVVTTWSES